MLTILMDRLAEYYSRSPLTAIIIEICVAFFGLPLFLLLVLSLTPGPEIPQ